MVDCISVDQILIQIIPGLFGSLLAGGLIAIISERRFNRAIKVSEKNIVSSIKPLNTTATSIAKDIKTLELLNRNTSTIATEIKTLAQVVDKLREGLEKKE